MRRRRTSETYSDAQMGRNLMGLVAVGLGVGLAETLGHGGQKLVGERRDLVDDTGELALAEDQDLHVLLGDHRRRSGPAVEERQLAEVLAGAELGDLPLPA